MEFKIGDKVRRKKGRVTEVWLQNCNGEKKDPKAIYDVISLSDSGNINVGVMGDHHWNKINFELVESSELQGGENMGVKKVIRVLVVSKETGKTEKNLVVAAENEQLAVLKAFGVDADKVFIKTTEEGEYKEDKPITAILEKK